MTTASLDSPLTFESAPTHTLRLQALRRIDVFGAAAVASLVLWAAIIFGIVELVRAL